ncbi:MAG: YhfC family glutamic-type intramembrane protease [Eubacteriales bacterium]|nr:YhfC family glutamic-type intramembrane protease [Eubacteriales bacterium]
MISTASLLGCLFSLAVSLVLPIGFIIYYGFRHRGEGVVSAWILGAMGFVIPQLLIRLPLLQSLAAMPGFGSFVSDHYLLYALGLAVTAGLFEFAGRFAVAKYIEKKGRLGCRVSLAAGLGHGGIEAIILVGMTYINNLVLLFMIQSGGFDALIAQTAAVGGDTAALTGARDLLLATPSLSFFLAGIERLLAMTAHVGMSLVVCYSVYRQRAWLGFAICVGYHTLIDASCALASPQLGLSQGASYAIIYTILTAMAVLALFVIRRIRRSWEKEAAHA